LGVIFTLARYSEAFLLLRAHDVGLNIGLVPVVMITMNVAYATLAYPAGVAADRIGTKRLLLAGIAALVLAGQHSTWSIRRSALWWFKRRQRHGHVETVLRVVLDPELLD